MTDFEFALRRRTVRLRTARPRNPTTQTHQSATMLAGTCHCGAVRIEVPRRPRRLTSCNCSICRRYGVLWAYYRAADVRVICERGATQSYAWGPKALRFVRCATCGCVISWVRVRPRKANYMGVNARNLDPSIVESVRIRRLDGAVTWKYLD